LHHSASVQQKGTWHRGNFKTDSNIISVLEETGAREWCWRPPAGLITL
jgi:hypothetical protein